MAERCEKVRKTETGGWAPFTLISRERERAAHCAVNSLKYLNKSLLCANEEKLKPEQFPALSARLFHFQQKTLFAAKSDVILTLAHYSHTELP